jgi:hypothetical protein
LQGTNTNDSSTYGGPSIDSSDQPKNNSVIVPKIDTPSRAKLHLSLGPKASSKEQSATSPAKIPESIVSYYPLLMYRLSKEYRDAEQVNQQA